MPPKIIKKKAKKIKFTPIKESKKIPPLVQYEIWTIINDEWCLRDCCNTIKEAKNEASIYANENCYIVEVKLPQTIIKI